MELFGIRFAPLNIPLKRRLQTFAAATWFVTMAFGGFIGFFFAMYLVFFTSLRWLVLLYVSWAWVIDRATCETGGRRSEWVRSWAWWQYFRDYFPLKLERIPWVDLNPDKNYLFCCFPHGVLSVGAFNAFATNVGGFKDLFPKHKPYVLSLAQHFHMPFFRELAFSLGGCSSSAKSLRWILNAPGGGKVALLVVGGVKESYFCRPGQYRLILKNRKGFVKLALEAGTPLVPVISFGETDLFNQVGNPDGSLLHKIQEWLRKIIGIAPIILIGRGFFQYSFGIIPQRRPVTVVVGTPLEVEKVEHPTEEQINSVHEKFMKHLTTFFEEQKHNYLENPEDSTFMLE